MTKKPHHHGNLREALITAGLALLEEGGSNALTLRKCAERAGVSHAAPAHHFNGIHGLKSAIVAWGFKRFADMMREHRDNAVPDPHARLLAICHGYIAFSQAHREVFELMFSPLKKGDISLDAITSNDLKENSAAAYNVLHESCAPFTHEQSGDLATETMIWSLVHGYATLFTEWGAHSGPSGEVANFDDLLPLLQLR